MTSDIQPSLLTFSDVPASPSCPAEILELSKSLVAADFKAVLTSNPVRAYFASHSDLWRGLVPHTAYPTTSTPSTTSDDVSLSSPFLPLVVGIACLHAFIQENWTGPSLEIPLGDMLPADVMTTGGKGDSSQPHESESESESPSSESSSLPSAAVHEIHANAIALLAKDGEPAYHLASQPHLMVLALRLFAVVKREDVWSADWWRLRAAIVHQHLLDEPVPYDQGLQASVERLLETSRDHTSLGLPDSLLATLAVEVGLSHHVIGQDRQAGHFFVQAARLHSLEYHLTGALGKRTKFQVNELSQLVLLAKSRESLDERDGQQQTQQSGEGAENVAQEIASTESGAEGKDSGAGAAPATLALNDDTLLEQTQFTSSALDNSKGTIPASLAHLNPQNQPALHPLDQSLLIDMCLAQHNTTPENGLTASQMAPYLERCISHPRNWSVHTCALLLRARLEARRSRTVERSALQLQALVDQMPTADSSVKERLMYFHQLPLPSKWEMEKELAQRFLSLGVVRSALEIFERLEMWEEAVKCQVSMERSDRAVAIVQDLLSGRKAESDITLTRAKLNSAEKTDRLIRIDKAREAKLWCLLGDLQPDHAEEFYLKAWEISNHTSSRSQRSLGALYITKQEFSKAIPLFQAALKINPLYARSWFVLGCAYVREERWEEAKEDAEGWNNLAAVYLRMPANASKKTRTAQEQERDAEIDEDVDEEAVEDDNRGVDGIPFANKRLAFRALQQGLRFARDNWRMWQNYMVVSVDVGELSEAARAQSRLVEDRPGRDASAVVDVAVLSKLVDAVTREDWNGGEGSLPEGKYRTSNEGLGLLPMVNRLFDQVILPRVSDQPRIYVIQARLKRWQEDWAGALDCYLKAYRAGIAVDSKVETELDRFQEAVQDVEELVDLMRSLGPRAAAQEQAAGLEKGKAKWSDWRFQARTLVRTFMGRTRESFGDEPETERLKEMLSDLRS